MFSDKVGPPSGVHFNTFRNKLGILDEIQVL